MGTSRTKASNKYSYKTYDRITTLVKKGRKDEIKEHAAAFDGGSVNAFINRAIDEQIQRDKKQIKTEGGGDGY